MSGEFTITKVEVKEEKPEWQGKGATIYRYTVDGDPRRPEEFVVSGNQPKKVGDSVEIEDSDYGPKVKKAQRQGGGFQKSPAVEKRIVRQHSQEMAVRTMAILGRVLPEDDVKNLISWFEDDAYGKMKSGTNRWPMTSDVPADLSDTPIG